VTAALDVTIMMRQLINLVGVLALSLVAAVPTVVLAQQPPSEPQGEFLPIDQLPPAEQLPAAPLLVAAYAFAWLAVFFYLWTVWRRLNKVESEMLVLQKRPSRQREG
jgi:CcmD family protein